MSCSLLRTALCHAARSSPGIAARSSFSRHFVPRAHTSIVTVNKSAQLSSAKWTSTCESRVPWNSPGDSVRSLDRKGRTNRKFLCSAAMDGDGSPDAGRIRRFAVLQTGHASPYTEKAHGTYGELFTNMLRDPVGEEWTTFSVIDGEFPTEEDLEKFEGWVVTGSRHDAHGTEEWIERLCQMLQKLYQQRKAQILGVCFGHQVLSRALGGETGRASSGWDLGLIDLKAAPGLASKPYAQNLPPMFRMLAIHQDQVARVPPGGELLASSANTSVEMFCVGDTVLGIQGHPEFTDDILEDLVATRLEAGIITEDVATSARTSMASSEADAEALQRLCKAFLKGTPR
eukprot:TRINITY_DN10649_c0_g1_i1.p1 TRINITY_DN10649_c0_g1~~TRINITY_DN10649_c0_g1_i1.p1  ORF type:complete len:344 (-),score=36.92 TRINITY_DN10649_c0_g1_i1:518-1549(-)